MNTHAKKIGFLTRTYVRLASPNNYVKDLGFKADIINGFIEIKKQHTCDRGVRSKVLVVHAIEEKAKEISNKLQEIKTSRCKHAPCRDTSIQERLLAMQANDMMNIDSRFETLCDVTLTTPVQDKEDTSVLEDVLLDVEYNGQKLFIAVEQGSGKNSEDVHVVLNPRVKNKAREWIVNQYPLILIGEEVEGKSSIDPDVFSRSAKYNDSLKEFLTPIINAKEAKKMKKYANKLRLMFKS